MLHQDIRTLKDLKDILNNASEEDLQKPLYFGLVDDDLEDSWEVTGIREINDGDVLEPEDMMPEGMVTGSIILYPHYFKD